MKRIFIAFVALASLEACGPQYQFNGGRPISPEAAALAASQPNPYLIMPSNSNPYVVPGTRYWTGTSRCCAGSHHR